MPDYGDKSPGAELAQDAEREMPPLFPEIPPEREAISVPLDQFPPDALLLSPEVDQGLVESIKEWGLQQPVVVGPLENGEREIYAGNRRIKACRRLGMDEIDAYELIQDPNSTVDPRVLAEQLNSTAKPNAILQLEAIETLEAKGYPEKEIAKALKLKLGTVRARMRLKKLHPKLRQGVRRNKISFGNADRIAKMSEATQERLAKRFAEDGKLPWSVIDEERRVKVEEVTEAFDIDLGEMPGAESFTDAVQVTKLPPSMHRTAEELGIEPFAPVQLEDGERERLAKKVEAAREGKKPKMSMQDAHSIAKLLGIE